MSFLGPIDRSARGRYIKRAQIYGKVFERLSTPGGFTAARNAELAARIA